VSSTIVRTTSVGQSSGSPTAPWPVIPNRNSLAVARQITASIASRLSFFTRFYFADLAGLLNWFDSPALRGRVGNAVLVPCLCVSLILFLDLLRELFWVGNLFCGEIAFGWEIGFGNVLWGDGGDPLLLDAGYVKPFGEIPLLFGFSVGSVVGLLGSQFFTLFGQDDLFDWLLERRVFTGLGQECGSNLHGPKESSGDCGRDGTDEDGACDVGDGDLDGASVVEQGERERLGLADVIWAGMAIVMVAIMVAARGDMAALDTIGAKIAALQTYGFNRFGQ
jgi:hypothetical protein